MDFFCHFKQWIKICGRLRNKNPVLIIASKNNSSEMHKFRPTSWFPLCFIIHSCMYCSIPRSHFCLVTQRSVGKERCVTRQLRGRLEWQVKGKFFDMSQQCDVSSKGAGGGEVNKVVTWLWLETKFDCSLLFRAPGKPLYFLVLQSFSPLKMPLPMQGKSDCLHACAVFII